MTTNSRTTRGATSLAEEIASLSIRERLIFAQAVYEHGSKAWSDIAKILSRHPLISRPRNFFSVPSCQTIYTQLMKDAELERSESNDALRDPSHLKLAQRHYMERVLELRSQLAAEEAKFRTLVTEIDEIRSGLWDSKILGGIDAPVAPLPQHGSSGEHYGVETSLNEIEMKEVPPPSSEDHKELHTNNNAPGFAPQQVAVLVSGMDAVADYGSPDMQNEGNEWQTSPQNVDIGAAGETALEVDETAPEQVVSMGHETVGITGDATPGIIEDGEGATVTNGEGNSVDRSTEIGGPREDVELPQASKPEVEDEDDEDDDTPLVVTRQLRARSSTAPKKANDSADSAKPPFRDKPRSRSSQKLWSKDGQHTNSVEPINNDQRQTVVGAADMEPKEEGEDMEVQGEDTADETDASPGEEDEEAEAVLPSKRDQKRKASDGDGVLESRDNKKAREGSEGTDDAESPATPSAAATVSKNTKAERKRFQNVIYMLHSQISQHRNGNIFHHPIKKSEAPDYHDIVRRPVDLKTIKARVKDGQISTSMEFQRDIFLMFANSMMYNRPSSDIYRMAEDMMLESEVQINTFRQTEGYARTRL